MTVVTFIVIKYSKEIYELHSLLLFQRLSSVYVIGSAKRGTSSKK